MLDGLTPIPGVVQNSRFDVLAYNQPYGHLFADLDALPLGDRKAKLDAGFKIQSVRITRPA